MWREQQALLRYVKQFCSRHTHHVDNVANSRYLPRYVVLAEDDTISSQSLRSKFTQFFLLRQPQGLGFFWFHAIEA